MATALDLITRSMRLSGVIGKGETPDDDEARDGLAALNAMLDSWQVNRLFVYQIRTEQFTWDANDQTQTAGSGGDFNTDLPTRVDGSCSFTLDSTDYPVTLIDIDAWSAIPDKTTTSSFPQWLYVEYGAALVTLYAYPIPNANITFNLRTWRRLQQFSTLTTDLALPPGNERAIAFSLAEEFGGPEFGIVVPDDVRRIAKAARKTLKNVNSPSPVMSNEPGYMSRMQGGFINGDVII